MNAHGLLDAGGVDCTSGEGLTLTTAFNCVVALPDPPDGFDTVACEWIVHLSFVVS
jgi:hypothetical protein